MPDSNFMKQYTCVFEMKKHMNRLSNYMNLTKKNETTDSLNENTDLLNCVGIFECIFATY
jgi:hypothetical protein